MTRLKDKRIDGLSDPVDDLLDEVEELKEALREEKRRRVTAETKVLDLERAGGIKIEYARGP